MIVVNSTEAMAFQISQSDRPTEQPNERRMKMFEAWHSEKVKASILFGYTCPPHFLPASTPIGGGREAGREPRSRNAMIGAGRNLEDKCLDNRIE